MDRNGSNLLNSEEKKAWQELLGLICSIEDADELASLFDDILTDKEVLDIIQRLLILEDLTKGKSQRDIASKRKMSLCKITRGSKMLKKKDGYMRGYLNNKYDDHTHL